MAVMLTYCVRTVAYRMAEHSVNGAGSLNGDYREQLMLVEFSNKLLEARQNSNYGIGIPDSLKANLKT